MPDRPVRVLFLCLGNICRSPLAEGLFQRLVDDAGLGGSIEVASAGTGPWHVGEPPDRRMQATAARHGVDLSRLRGRQLSPSDLDYFDYILAMDGDNLRGARALGSPRGTVERFRSFDPEPGDGDVPDPYYGGGDGFERVYETVDRTTRALLRRLVDVHALQASNPPV